MIRGRGLSKEQCKQSLCAFCAHRLGTARLPSHIQRRFLQSSRPNSKPPTSEPATSNEHQSSNNNDAPPNTGSSWGQTPGKALGPGSGSSWGGSSLGNEIPRPATGWGGSGSGIPLRPGSVPVNQSNEPPQPAELLPHEQRARDLLLERQRIEERRQVKVNAGPGPESNRAGRPEPGLPRYTGATVLNEAREIARKRANKKAAVMEGLPHQGSRKILFNRYTGDDNYPTTSISTPSGVDSSQGWNGLRRRAPESSPPRDEFAEARRRREEQAKNNQYTPLRQRSNREPQDHRFSPTRASQTTHEHARQSNAGSRLIDFSHRLDQNDSSIELQPSQEHMIPRNLTSRVVVDQGDANNFNSRAPETLQEESARDSLAAKSKETATFDEDDEARVISRPKKTKQPKSPARFDMEPAPKGKDRDKARRRERFDYDEEGEEETPVVSKQALKEQRKKEKAAKKAALPTPVLLPEYISVSNLAVALRIRFEDFVEKLYEMGFEEMSHDHILNSETAGLIAQEFNFEPIIDRGDAEDLKPRPPPEDPSVLPQRPPVVTIMGHVDHGKTTLLDWLRKSSVAASEHGGITQHIGAFSVPMPGGKLITFLDTPGHAAFLSMRQRGANVTDIVILVVAADDSVKPQTIEAINHAKAAKVPVIVAINKIDKEDSNIEKVKQDLSRHGVEIEDYGGDTQVICVSGKTGQGMEELEEAAVTLSEIIDMRAEIDGQAEGWIIEASIKPIGKAATVLVKRGTLRTGDFVVAGRTWARIRALRNEAGIVIPEVGPGMPVEIDGWKELPEAGDQVLQAPDEAKAKAVMEFRVDLDERNKMAEDMEAINEFRKGVDDARERIREAAARAADAEAEGEEADADTEPQAQVGPKQIYFIVKGDVSGSVEAVVDSISGIGNGEVQPHILRSGVGQLNEFDIEHAAAAKGHVITFNTEIDESVASLAKYAKVGIIDNNVIYRLVDDVKAKLSEYLPPLITQRVLGEAEIAQVFEITIKGRTTRSIAGCKVRNGLVSKNAKVRVLRNGEKVFDGKLASLKNKKKDEMEMRKGMECGMGFENWFEFQVGDQVQCYEEKEEKRYL
ncbi:translation initiation factor IF-2 [Phlyctema vagabunda]|uniref:Translation initiation factor IF-2, mitochondrial n=1 Tax=Phlyctema vagabunda TaxID=108571 RepID=A0ABR4PT56_9HELO